MAMLDKVVEFVDSLPDDTAKTQFVDMLSIEGKAQLLNRFMQDRKGVEMPPEKVGPAGGGVAGAPVPGQSASGVEPASGPVNGADRFEPKL